MTVVNPKSISGINSITTGSGSDNLLTIHTSDASSTERVRINSSGDVIVGSGITVSPDGDIFATGGTTSTTFSGNFSGGTVSGTTGIVTTLTATGLTVDSGTTNTCATFKSSDAGAVINLTDSAARSSIEQNDTTLKIIADTDASDADSKIQFQVDSSTKATIDSSGNLGLGINSPTAASSETALHVYANEYPEVHLTSSVTGSNAGDGSIFTLNNDSSTIIRNQENSYIRFDTNGSNERARIEPAGNVKIEKNLNVVGVCTAATVNDSIGELRAFPVTNYGSNVVIAGHHAGKCITNTSGGWTINASTDFAVGEVMRVVNKSASGQIVYQGGSALLYSSRDGGSGGDHSIKARGSAIVICTAADEYYISGDI